MVLLLLALLGAPPEDAVRAQIEEVLTRMEAAVLASDADAYLACVSDADANFRMEQINWAADLARHRPSAFDLAIGGPGAGDAFTDARAEFTLVMTYTIDAGHARALPFARASCPVVFTRDDPDGEGPEPARWFFRGENWIVRAADGFDVRYFPGAEDVVDQVLAAFPVAKAHVDAGFEIENRTPQQIKLYRDMEHLKAWVYLSMPDTVLGGWNEPGESIKFMETYARDVRGWTRAFAHEYGHVATWELGDKAKGMPWWVAEGAAELAAEAFDADKGARNDALIRRLAARGELAPWDQISDYDEAPARLKYLAYEQGRHFVGYFSQRWGRSGRNAWLRAITGGATVDAATREVTGMSFDELDAAWRGTLKEEKP